MDSTQSLEMRIGLLVVAGVAALVVLILATDRISWDDRYQIQAYMDDAAGLNVGSPVKLAGITVGSVTAIEPSDDPRGQIMATLSIQGRYTIDRSSELKNSPSGIFGDNILTFSSPADAIPDPLPKDGSAEVVTSDTFITQAQNQAEAILAGLSQLLGEESVGEMRTVVQNAGAMTDAGTRLLADLRGEVGQLQQTLASVQRLAEDLRASQGGVAQRVESTMVELEATLAQLRRNGESLAGDVSRVSDRLEAALAASTELAGHGNALLAAGGEDLVATIADLRALSADLRELAAGAAAGRGVVGQLLTSDALAKDLNDTVITTAQLAERVSDNPDILFWGTTQEEREEARRAREARRVRRAFMEGFEYRTEPIEKAPPAAASPGEVEPGGK